MIDIQIVLRNLDTGKIRTDHIYEDGNRVSDDTHQFIRELKEINKEFGENCRIIRIRYKHFEEDNEDWFEKY